MLREHFRPYLRQARASNRDERRKTVRIAQAPWDGMLRNEYHLARRLGERSTAYEWAELSPQRFPDRFPARGHRRARPNPPENFPREREGRPRRLRESRERRSRR